MRTYLQYIIIILFSSSNLFAQFNQTAKVVSSDRQLEDSFGSSVSISGSYAIIGAMDECHDVAGNNNMFESGAAYIFQVDANGNANEVQKIVASDRAENDHFGFSSDIDGDYAIIGAYREGNDVNSATPMTEPGAAYIFERDINGNWIEVQKLVANDRAAIDHFAYSVSISGNYAVIGALQEDNDENGNGYVQQAGSAYIFKRDASGSWNQIQKIVAFDRNTGDLFGWRVAISGNNLVVAASSEDNDENGNGFMNGAGSAYIYTLVGSVWQFSQKIVASDRNFFDRYGYAIDISNDLIVVSAEDDDEDENGNNTLAGSGSVYIYKQDVNGNWSEIQKIVASDREAQDVFGGSVSVSDNYIIVSAIGEDHDLQGNNFMNSAGSVYVFEPDCQGVWSETQKIVPTDRFADDTFGYSVSVSGDIFVSSAVIEDEDSQGNNSLVDAGSSYFFKTTNFVQPIEVNLNDTSFCSGDNITLSVSNYNNASYLWSTGEITNAINISTAGEYWIQIFANCDTIADTIQVTVNNCSFAVNDTSICLNDTAKIRIISNFGVPPYTYSWTGGLPPTAGPHYVSPTVTTNYTVTVTDGNGQTMSDVATITINENPNITATIINESCNQQNGEIDLNVSGGNTFTYIWSNT